MLGWRRRSEGFEWRKYVRTTIALRRQARREKADQLREQAAEGMKKAGAKAGAAARQGARQLGAGSRVAASGVASGLGVGLRWLARSAGAAAGAAGRGVLAAGRGAGRAFDRYGPKSTWARAVGAVGVLGAVFAAGWALKPAPGQRGTFASLPSLPSLSLLSLGGPSTTSVTGRAVVAGPGMVRIGQTTIRLSGIEAPDRDQVCTRPGNRRWRCGDAAAQALTRMAGGRNLACETRAPDAAGIVSGTCLEGKSDIGSALVKGGHVFATTGFRAPYGREETEARTAKLGLWSGEAERPEAWRARVWAEAQKRTPDGCPIKGRVAGNARVYVLPWSAEYERVRVDVRRGGRWFCTERDALDAGWKPEVRS